MQKVNGNLLVTRNGTFLYPKGEELSDDELKAAIDWNTNNQAKQYRKNMKMYLGQHDILDKDKDDLGHQFGPDNRLVVNKAKYIVDTYNGYFVGIPPTVTLDKGPDNDSLQDWLNRESFADQLNELSKQADIYGRSIGFVYQNEDKETCFQYVSPTKSFMIYDDTLARQPLAFVMYEYYDTENDYAARGTIYYAMHSYDFDRGKIDQEQHPNVYKMVPAVEFYENEERQGVTEPVDTLINALDAAYSQKANQLAYFDMAYLVMMGVQLPEDKDTHQPKVDLAHNRFLYLPNVTAGSNPKVEFLSKPADDGMQEHYIQRLEDSIFEISMVPNMNDQAFSGNSSGVALQYKLLPMQNKASSKERKFTQSLRQLFKIVFSVGKVIPERSADAWQDLQIHFTRNLPADVANMIATARNAEGIVSQRTQMKLLPGIVDDPDDEIEQINKEKADSIKRAQQAVGVPDANKDQPEGLNNDQTEEE